MARFPILAVAALLAAAIPAFSADAPAWPPTPELRDRMRELQATIGDPKATPEARRDARSELMNLLRSPEAAPVDPDKPRPARAAVPPMPAQSPIRTNPRSDVPDPPVATVTSAPRARRPIRHATPPGRPRPRRARA